MQTRKAQKSDNRNNIKSFFKVKFFKNKNSPLVKIKALACCACKGCFKKLN